MRSIITVLFSTLLIVSTQSYSTSHTINFGIDGHTYNPNNISVNVGDTIMWVGSFEDHPLSSTSVPTGADTFKHDSGSTYLYVVLIPGTYHYQCDNHFDEGMIGQFTTNASGTTSIGHNAAINIFPSVTKDFLNVVVNSNRSELQYNIFNVTGKLVQSVKSISEKNVLDVSALNNGLYFLMVKNEDRVLVVKKFEKN